MNDLKKNKCITLMLEAGGSKIGDEKLYLVLFPNGNYKEFCDECLNVQLEETKAKWNKLYPTVDFDTIDDFFKNKDTLIKTLEWENVSYFK
jgi:hypothetical protein